MSILYLKDKGYSTYSNGKGKKNYNSLLLKVNVKWKWKEEKSFNYRVNLHVKFGRPKQSVVLTEATE